MVPLYLYYILLQWLTMAYTYRSTAVGYSAEAKQHEGGVLPVPYSSGALSLDGLDSDSVWRSIEWQSLNHLWMGDSVDSKDYHGQFKVAWDAQYLYLFLLIRDDVLHAMLKDGPANFWKGYYVEVFLDADDSGGPHQYNHQAFAYHIGPSGHALDKSVNQSTVFFDDHVKLAFKAHAEVYTWEIALKVFADDFKEEDRNNIPVHLKPGMRLGFSLAYGDNDGREERENFMGSKASHGINNDEGYTNADVFGTIILMP